MDRGSNWTTASEPPGGPPAPGGEPPPAGGPDYPPPPAGPPGYPTPQPGAYGGQGGGYPPPAGLGGPPPGGQQVPNYLVPAIIAVFCCWPTAIAAIVFAAQVNSKLQAGDMAGAMDSSKKARTWTIVSFVAGGIGWVLGIIFYVLLFAAAMSPAFM